MKRIIRGLVLCVFLWGFGMAAAGELTIINPSICKGVHNHQPVDAGENFPPDVNRLFCYTRVVGPFHVDKTQHVDHVWYYRQEERARVTLPVKSSSWGTYSSKIISPGEVGSWHVDVLDTTGEKLITLPFSIQ